MTLPLPDHQRVIVGADPFVPGGALASVAIGGSAAAAASVDDTVPLDERALAATMSPTRQASFVAGRRALRAAVARVAPSHADAPLLRTERGAPALPVGMTGSISHKRTRAMAVAMPTSGALLGLDLEDRPTARDLTRPSIADRILTGLERDALRRLEGLAHREATLVYFAVKEAVYKSIDPYVARYVRFTEVELDVTPDGVAAVRLFLPEPVIRDVHVTATWRFDGEFIVAMARSERR